MKTFIPDGLNRKGTTDTAQNRDLNLRPLRLRVGYSTDARPVVNRPSWIRNSASQIYTLGQKQ